VDALLRNSALNLEQCHFMKETIRLSFIVIKNTTVTLFILFIVYYYYYYYLLLLLLYLFLLIVYGNAFGSGQNLA